MAEETVQIRLSLNTDAVDKEAKQLAGELQRTLGSIRVNNKLIDLGDSADQVARLTAEVNLAKAALSDKKGAAELQKQARILQEQLRFKQQLAAIDGAGLSEADAKAARALATELNKLNLEKIAKGFDDLNDSAGKTNIILQGILQGVGQRAFDFLAGSVSGVASSIASSTLQFEKFRTVLKTAFGDAELAEEALDGITRFASTTPFQLDEVVSAFIALKNRGIEPTNEVLRQLGDITASQGKSLNQITEALLDAASGEFERLKEFGITAKTQGDKVTLAFKGVNKEVEKTPEALAQAVLAFGDLQGVAGSTENLSKTLGGQLSNLQDNLTQAAVAFGDELLPVLLEFVEGVNQAGPGLRVLAKELGEGTAVLLQLLANALKLGADNAEILAAAVLLLTQRFLALKAVSLLQTVQATAVQMGLLSVGAKGAALSLATVVPAAKAAVVALAPLALQLVAITAAIEGIKFAKFANDLANANTEIAGAGAGVEALSGAAIAAAERTKATTDKLNAAREQGRKLTKAEIKDGQALVAANDLRLKQLQEELEKAEALPAANDEQKRSREALIATLNTSIKALEGQNSKLKELTGTTDQSTQADKDKRSELEKLNDAYGRQEQIIQNFFANRQADIAEAVAAGNLTEEQARQQNFEAEQKYLTDRLALLQENLPKLRALEASTTDPEERRKLGDQILKAEGNIAKARLDLATKAANQRKRAEEKALREIEEANAEAAANIAQSQTDRTAEIRKLQAQGALSAQEAERQIQQIQAESTAATVAQKEKELAEVRKLRDEGTLSAEEAAKRERELITEIGQLNLKRIEDEIAAQEAAKQAQIKALKEQADAEQRASRRVLAEYDRRRAALSDIEAALQRQTDLLNSQANLTRALNNLDQVRGQTSVDRLNRALEIQARLSDRELETAAQRRVLEKELSRLGFSRETTQADLLRQRQAEEQRLAQLQQDALKARQAQERASLDLELRRNELASQRAILESQIAEIQARQNEAAARAALREAQITGDQNAVANAQLELELAQQGSELARQATALAQDNAAAQSEVADAARAALAAQQEAERTQANAAEEARQFAAALESAAASSTRIANNLGTGRSLQARREGGPVSPGQPYLVGEEGPEIILPHRSGYVLTAQQTAALLNRHIPQSMFFPLSPSLPPSLIKELRAIRNDLKTLGRPVQNNSFTLQTPAPTTDALSLHAGLLRNQIRALGL